MSFTVSGISYRYSPDLGYKEFRYETWHNGSLVSIESIYCRHRDDYLELLKIWSRQTKEWKYKEIE